ncbi:MAG: GIDE domain-containing protein [Halobacteriales archaeon]|nr:GIDE domain-containing protein [Halobacteriales archaeon]
MLRGYDTATVLLALTSIAMFTSLVYVVVGPFGVLVVPLFVAMFYLLPGDVLKSIDTNGVRLALLLVNGLLVGWIPAEYFGEPPLDESGEFAFSAGLVVFAFGFAAFFGCLYSFWRYYHISTTETAEVASVEEGKVEVEGEIEPAREILTAPVSGEDCVAYEYEATQRRWYGSPGYRPVVETERKSKPFYVDDGTGRVLVEPQDAHIETDEHESEHVEAGSSGYDHDTTRKEVRVPDEGNIYVFGTAEWSDEHGQITVRNGDAPFFKISDSSEAELVDRYRKIAMLSFAVAFVGLPVGTWLILRASGVF